MAQSSWAQVVREPESTTAFLDWPAGELKPVGVVSFILTTEVRPYTGRSARQSVITVEVILLFANIKVEGVQLSAPELPVEGSGNAVVEVSCEVGVDMSESKPKLTHGSYQT